MMPQPATALPRKKVFLVDDHPLVRMGLTNIINQEEDLTVCGETDGEDNVLQLAQGLRPDIAVVDWSLIRPTRFQPLVNARSPYTGMPGAACGGALACNSAPSPPIWSA